MLTTCSPSCRQSAHGAGPGRRAVEVVVRTVSNGLEASALPARRTASPSYVPHKTPPARVLIPACAPAMRRLPVGHSRHALPAVTAACEHARQPPPDGLSPRWPLPTAGNAPTMKLSFLDWSTRRFPTRGLTHRNRETHTRHSPVRSVHPPTRPRRGHQGHRGRREGRRQASRSRPPSRSHPRAEG